MTFHKKISYLIFRQSSLSAKTYFIQYNFSLAFSIINKYRTIHLQHYLLHLRSMFPHLRCQESLLNTSVNPFWERDVVIL